MKGDAGDADSFLSLWELNFDESSMDGSNAHSGVVHQTFFRAQVALKGAYAVYFQVELMGGNARVCEHREVFRRLLGGIPGDLISFLERIGAEAVICANRSRWRMHGMLKVVGTHGIRLGGVEEFCC